MMTFRIALLSLCVPLLGLPGAHAATKYYKWVDAQGSTHYTQTPPPPSRVAKRAVKTVTVTQHVNGSSVPGYAPQARPMAPVAPPIAPVTQSTTVLVQPPGGSTAAANAPSTALPSPSTTNTVETGNNNALPDR